MVAGHLSAVEYSDRRCMHKWLITTGQYVVCAVVKGSNCSLKASVVSLINAQLQSGLSRLANTVNDVVVKFLTMASSYVRSRKPAVFTE
jgi:hypothetical protein